MIGWSHTGQFSGSMKASAFALFCAFLLAGCDPPGKPKANSAQEEDRSKITDFKTLYESNCSGCHGSEGHFGPARILNDPLYLAFLPKTELHNILVNGRKGTAMPAWAISEGGPLTDQQIDILTDGIYKAWSKPERFANASLPPYSADVKEGNVTNGKKLFVRNCFACHAPGGLVGPVTTPSYLALSSNQLIRKSIVIGRSDLGMPNYRTLNLGKPLSNGDINDLVAYLDSLRPPEGRTSKGGAIAGEQAGGSGTHENENGAGEGKPTTKGNEGSGNGPGSSRHQEREGNKGKGSNSQQGVK
jgi:cytochrome c oxidase cbb3-type subunit 3/ubiquinol-cytochrome c reductase cytochrome c subunit